MESESRSSSARIEAGKESGPGCGEKSGAMAVEGRAGGRQIAGRQSRTGNAARQTKKADQLVSVTNPAEGDQKLPGSPSDVGMATLAIPCVL